MTKKSFLVPIILVYILCGIRSFLSAQITIDTIKVSETRMYSFDLISATFESKDTTVNHISNALKSIVSGQLQITTPGGLHTFLHRGLGNRHVQVLWNGANIQSIVNGSFDLSLIPTNLFDKMSFYTVGAPTLTGNNGLSGCLNLDQSQYKSSIFEISLSASTLQNYRGSITSNYQKNKYFQRIGIDYSYEKNIFTYQDGLVTAKRTSTDFGNKNFTYTSRYQLTKKQSLHLDLWYQSSGRLIPTSITSAPVYQSQTDDNLRANLSHSFSSKSYVFNSSAVFMKEKIGFFTNTIESLSDVNILQLTTEMVPISKKNIYLNLKYRNDKASPNFYNEEKIRNTVSLAASKKISISNHFINQFSIRQDVVDNKLMPISISGLFSYKNNSLSISKNYNLPGFNDLYYPTGGNPDLKLEKNIQAELSSNFSLKKTNIKVSLHSNIVNNWIQWTPQSSGFWSALNQKKVWSRGVEIQASKQWQVHNLFITARLDYAWTRSTNIEHYTDPSLVGKQLIYIPEHKVNISTSLTYKNWDLHIQHRWTDKRATNPDNSLQLSSYHLIDLGFQYQTQKHSWILHFNNVLHQRYEIIPFFPMPRVNAQLTYKYSISNKNIF